MTRLRFAVGRNRKTRMDLPRKRAAEEQEGGKQKKQIKLSGEKEAEEKSDAAHAAWQQQPGMGASFKFSSYVKVNLIVWSL